jgi:hypothetical protein
LLDEFKLISYILNKKMKTEGFNKIVDEVYNHYLETHQYEPFILQEEMDLSKEDFIKKVTNNYGFGQLFGISLNERELGNKERIELAFKSIESTDGNSAALLWELSCQGKKESEIMETLNNSPRNIPSKLITITYNDKTIESYE